MGWQEGGCARYSWAMNSDELGGCVGERQTQQTQQMCIYVQKTMCRVKSIASGRHGIHGHDCNEV